MFCAKCGNQLAEGTVFCPACGQKVGGAIGRSAEAHEGLSSQEQRKQTKEELKTIFGYFDQKEAEYDEYNNVHAEVYTPKTKSGCATFMIYALMADVIGALMFIPYSLIVKDGEGSPFYVVFTFIVALTVPIVILCLINRSQKKKDEQKKVRLAELEQELKAYYKAYADCPIGYEYSDPHTIAALYKLVESGRCDTIKEALNMAEDEAHKEYLRTAAAQTAADAKTAANASTASAIGVGVLVTRDLLRGIDKMF